MYSKVHGIAHDSSLYRLLRTVGLHAARDEVEDQVLHRHSVRIRTKTERKMVG